MNLNAYNILVGIAIILSVISLIRPSYPLLPVAVILVCTALLIGRT